MAYVAILGYGIVGSGAFSVLDTNKDVVSKTAGQPIIVKRILDLRDFKNDPAEALLTKNFEDILNDDEISIVAESMGGLEPAYTFVKKLLEKGKSVVTSNKELVAKHGAELLALSKKYGCHFLFEASVCGGIPIIHALYNSLVSDVILEISGILNGTTNYILSNMTTNGTEFSDVLLEAQRLGYAEKNPEADVEGHDACRKLAILSSLATGKQVNCADIHTEGITKICKEDIDYAEKMQCTIKLIAIAKFDKNGVFARVSPVFIDKTHPLSTVSDVFNAVYVKGNMLGETMYYGKGAGKLPTGSAIVSDIVESVRNTGKSIACDWSEENQDLLSIDNSKVRMFIRIHFSNESQAFHSIKDIFGSVHIIMLENRGSELGFLTSEMTEKEIKLKADVLKNTVGIVSINNQIRLY